MLQRWLDRLDERLAAAITAENQGQIAWLRLQKVATYLLLRQWRLALLSLTQAGMQSSSDEYGGVAAAYVQKAQYLVQAGQAEAARSALQQAVNLYTVIENSAGRGRAWQSVALQLLIRGDIEPALSLLQAGVTDLADEPLQQVPLYQWQMRLHILRLEIAMARQALDRAAAAAQADQAASDRTPLSDRIESYRQVLGPLFDGSQPLEALITLIVGLGQSLRVTIPDATDLLAANEAWENGRFHEALELAQAIRRQAMNQNKADFTRHGRYLTATLIRAQAYEQLGERTAALVTFSEARQWLPAPSAHTHYIDTILAHWAARWGPEAFRSAQRQAQRWEKLS